MSTPGCSRGVVDPKPLHTANMLFRSRPMQELSYGSVPNIITT
jgi:hypothetical protein